MAHQKAKSEKPRRRRRQIKEFFTANASIANMAAEIENDRRESVRKLAQAHDVSARTVHGALRIT
jgi:hypothetical protein